MITISKGFVKIQQDLLVPVSNTEEQGYQSKEVEIRFHIYALYLGSIFQLNIFGSIFR
jgi:hypothetical protein